jgi:hypothetical protein
VRDRSDQARLEDLFERACLEAWGGTIVWSQCWVEHYEPYYGGYGGNPGWKIFVRALWHGPHPGYPCHYCGAETTFQQWDARRPVPEGARDLGVTDPAHGWVCEGCGNTIAGCWVRDVPRPSFPFVLPGGPSHIKLEAELPMCGTCGAPFVKGSECLCMISIEMQAYLSLSEYQRELLRFAERELRQPFPAVPSRIPGTPGYPPPWFHPDCLPAKFASPPPLPPAALASKSGCLAAVAAAHVLVPVHIAAALLRLMSRPFSARVTHRDTLRVTVLSPGITPGDREGLPPLQVMPGSRRVVKGRQGLDSCRAAVPLTDR